MAAPKTKEKKIKRLERQMKQYDQNPKLKERIETKIRSLKNTK
jgi:hypothetical protein